MLEPGTPAPEFSAPDQSGTMISLRKLRGKKTVLYFYPKDMTEACTREACDFRDHLGRIIAAGATVIGVSPDTVASHTKFAIKEGLTFPLLADPEQVIVNDYGVWKEKSMYGRKFMGVERTTFLIDEAGKIERIFPKVRVKGHIQEVLNAIGG